jgi:hypothetical protein
MHRPQESCFVIIAEIHLLKNRGRFSGQLCGNSPPDLKRSNCAPPTAQAFDDSALGLTKRGHPPRPVRMTPDTVQQHIKCSRTNILIVVSDTRSGRIFPGLLCHTAMQKSASDRPCRVGAVSIRLFELLSPHTMTLELQNRQTRCCTCMFFRKIRLDYQTQI